MYWALFGSGELFTQSRTAWHPPCVDCDRFGGGFEPPDFTGGGVGVAAASTEPGVPALSATTAIATTAMALRMLARTFISCSFEDVFDAFGGWR
jgi:hypothetical protein